MLPAADDSDTAGWVTLRDVYHCAIDKELFAEKIKQAQTYAADMADTWITVAQPAIPDDQIIPLADLGFKPHPTAAGLMRGPDTAWIAVPLDKLIDHNAELRGMGFSPHPAHDALMRGPATETTRAYLKTHDIRYTIETTRTYLHGRKIKHTIERHESATVTEIRLRVEAVNRWHVHDWNILDNKIRSSIAEGVSVFLSMFDLPAVARVFCPPAPQARPARTAGDEGSNPALAATADAAASSDSAPSRSSRSPKLVSWRSPTASWRGPAATPLADKRRVQGVPTFAEAARRVVEQKQAGWRVPWTASSGTSVRCCVPWQTVPTSVSASTAVPSRPTGACPTPSRWSAGRCGSTRRRRDDGDRE